MRYSKVMFLVLAVFALISGIVVAQETTGQLEVFSWWTSGGEAAALDALFVTYNAAEPNVEIVNATVAGGGGSWRVAEPPPGWQSPR